MTRPWIAYYFVAEARVYVDTGPRPGSVQLSMRDVPGTRKRWVRNQTRWLCRTVFAPLHEELRVEAGFWRHLPQIKALDQKNLHQKKPRRS